MRTFTISEAKAKLSALVQAAEEGQEILIMRGSKPAVTLTPVTEDELSYWPQVPKAALADFDREIEADRKAGELKPLGRGAAVVKALSR
jgi:prevent-host-death family protein